MIREEVDILKKRLIEKLIEDNPTLSSREVANIIGCSRRHVRRVKRELYLYSAPKQQRILIFDIETLPMNVYVWGLYKQRIPYDNVIKEWCVLGWSAKWLFEPEIYSGILTPQEVANRNDSRVLKGIWDLLDEATIVITHNGCLTAGNKILKADFTWSNVEDLKIGDKILAFNEETPSIEQTNKPRKYEIGEVTYCSPILKECADIELEDGKIITATLDHPWLVRFSEKHRHWTYKTTEELMNSKTQRVLTKVLPVWEKDESYHAGYLASFLDGEGCINQCKRTDVYNGVQRDGYGFSITFSQMDDSIISKLKESLNYFKFKYSIKHYDKNNDNIKCIRILGGMAESIRFLGVTNPAKKQRIDLNLLQKRKMSGIQDIKIKNITPVGKKEVIGLSTSCKTYIAEGFPCHNSSFDIRKLNFRFALNDFTPPSPYVSIDTLKESKKSFAASSYALDYLCNMFCNKGKLKTGFQLWKDCDKGDLDALRTMNEYNKNDVVVLEDYYLKIRPWIKSHPNMGLYTLEEFDGIVCPTCGYTDLKECGEYQTKVNSFIAYRCNNCGAIGRGRKSFIKNKNILQPVAR